jgi:ATP-binding cassette subfamily F protein 3
VNQVANKIWYIEDKQIKEYPGTYEEYEYWKKKAEAELKGAPPPVKAKAAPLQPAEKEQAHPNEKKIKSLNQELKRVEEQIETLQKQKAEAESELAKPEVFGNPEKLGAAQQGFEKVNTGLIEANKKWEELVMALDELES